MTYSELSLIAAAAFVACVAVAMAVWRRQQATRAAAVAAGASLLIAGTWLALHEGNWLAALLICAGVGALAVAGLQETQQDQGRGHFALFELAVAAPIFISSAALRFIDITHFPGFIHGEESFWTWISGTYWFSNERPWPVDQYTTGVPVSFYLEWPFFKLFGVNFYAPRYEVAFLGTLSVILIYLAGRRVAGPWTGLTAAVFLSTSMVSLAGSRAAFVWGHALFWTVLTLFLYAETLERRSVALSIVTGIVLCLGCLTYHTYLPVVAVVVLHAGGVSGVELIRSRKAALFPVVLPMALVVPTIALWSRISAYLSTMRDYTTSGSHSMTKIGAAFWEAPDRYVSLGFANLKVLLYQLFVRQEFPDFLVSNTDGPTLLPGITLLALVGIAIMLRRPGGRRPGLLVLWIAIPLAFSPLVLGQPLLRTYSSAYPAIYLVAAQGLVSLAQAARDTMRGFPRDALFAPAASTLVLALALTGSLIYFKKTSATLDGEVRKSFVDDVLPMATTERRIVLPYATFTSDWVDVEQHSLRFALAGKFDGFRSVDSHYKIVPATELLTELQGGDASQAQLVVIQSPRAGPVVPQKGAMVERALSVCYPGARWTESGLWLVAEVNAADRRCDAVASIKLTAPTRSAGGLYTFQWDAPAAASSYRLTLERKTPLVDDFEMERFSPSNGWASDAKFVSGFSGKGYYFDNLDATVATIQFPVKTMGSYTVWFRTLRRRADDTGWRTAIDAQPGAELSPVTGTTLNQWNWEKAGTFDLSPGPHTLKLDRHGNGWAIFIDVMYLSMDPQFDPTSQPLWQSLTEVTSPGGAGRGSLTLDTPLPPGTYRWKVTSVDGYLVDGLGNPLASPYEEFSVP